MIHFLRVDYMKMEERFILCFKLACICNDKPKLPNNDQAAWNRIRVFPFESTFTSNAPNTFEEQLRQKKFPKDGIF